MIRCPKTEEQRISAKLEKVTSIYVSDIEQGAEDVAEHVGDCFGAHTPAARQTL
jgi:hypothetical protein